MNEMTALVAATDTSAPAVDAVPERILVALDASPHSLAALRAAAKLAATVHAELHGLFIEDDRLLRLCDSPFAREVGLLTAAVRPLDSTAVERKLRVMAGELRYALARAAAEVQVQWSFHVRRGAIERELLQESADALLLSLGRTSWLARRGLGATANALIRQTMRPLLLLGDREELSYPLTLIYTASPSAERALALAIRLTQQAGQPLHVIVVAPSADAAAWQERLSIMLRHNEIPGVFTVLEAEPNESSPTIATRLALIEAIQKRSAVLPTEYSSLMAELQGAVLLVP
ncbi:MAG: universal stress protein [Caldilineaceae bacterium]|nr:universal stress protein [Caldilineaceae bacterium]